jgi:HicB family
VRSDMVVVVLPVIDDRSGVFDTGEPVQVETAGKQYSGKFNLRVGEELHERLAIESMKVSESLNSYCVKVLKDAFGL